MSQKVSFFIGLSIFIFNVSYAQHIEIAPLSQNRFEKGATSQKSLSIDSSFVFTTDTVGMHFFDDFTTNKIQNYSPDFSNPLTTSTLFYYMIDEATNLVIANGLFFTNQVTFNRYFDPVSGTFTDTIFSFQAVNIADFSSYPVNYEPIDLYPPYYIYDTLSIDDEPDTVWIQNPPYFQDSVRQFFLPVSDPELLWIDDDVYHNYRFAYQPRTLGVMTFDGLDHTGYPYAIGTSSSGYADALTSKPIDLSGAAPLDSIYLSFIYQPQGLGDEPESTDSLVLEFLNQSSSQWDRIWGIEGQGVVPFEIVHLPITENVYFTDAFQFRFRNYGGLSGGLDQFHLDMVSLRNSSYKADTIFKDFSFVYPLNTLIKDYTSAPWDHYKESTDNKMSETLEIQVFNGSSGPENYQDGTLEILYNGISEGDFTLQGFTLAEQQINYAPLDFATSYHDLKNGYEFSRVLTGEFEEFDVRANVSAQFPNFEPNNSTAFTQGFYNFYSYDDGSAEAAFGPTGAQARLAIHFEAYESDSLIGIDLCFVPSVNDVSDKLFLLTVWEDDNGVPGAVLYEDDVFNPRSPIYSNSLNNFLSYFFIDTMTVAVGSSFFVGWRQLDPERLNLGFDRNIDQSDEIFYSVDGGASWLTSPFSGSAMLRPIFSTGMDASLGLESIEAQEFEFTAYPNPSKDRIFITNSLGLKGLKKTLLDGMGRVLFETNENHFDVTALKSGFYFVSIPEYSGSLIKVIKQ